MIERLLNFSSLLPSSMSRWLDICAMDHKRKIGMATPRTDFSDSLSAVPRAAD